MYSNSNYILLAQIIEKVTGQSFPRYMNGLFLKLGMRDMSFEPDHSNIRGPVARAYFNFDSWTTYNWIACGGGNLFTMLNDQVQWEKLVQGQVSSAIDSGLEKRARHLQTPVAMLLLLYSHVSQRPHQTETVNLNARKGSSRCLRGCTARTNTVVPA